jgi:hypothetical protein
VSALLARTPLCSSLRGTSDIAASIKKVKDLELGGDHGSARREADWNTWRTATNFENTVLLASALGLHRDHKRGHTHIVFKAMEYVPSERQLWRRFRVAQAAVFRIADVLQEIEHIMNINPGEGREYIDDLIKSVRIHEEVPIFELLFGKDIPQTWLGGSEGAIRLCPANTDCTYLAGSYKIHLLRPDLHEPNWRGLINRGATPPEPMKLIRKDIQDVEHVFD